MAEDFVIPRDVVFDKEKWKGVIKMAKDREYSIEIAYARTYGEEAQIAVELMLKELFGVELDLT